MTGTTKFIKLKRCINCWHITEFDQERCPLCKHLFLGEATAEEKEEAHAKLCEMHDKKEKS